MAWRAQFGLRSGVYGGWVSKPGYDVTSASPGQFLMDTSSQVFQRVGFGSQFIVTNVAASSTYTASTNLGSVFTPYSNIIVMAKVQCTYTDGSGTIDFSHSTDGYFELKHHSIAGIIYFTLTAKYPVNANFFANWWAFRGTF